MHDRPDLFKKTVDNGKTLKKPKAKSEAKATTGCNVFGKTNHTKIKEQNLEMTSDQVRKLVAAEWKLLGLVGQQFYKDLARNGEKEVSQDSIVINNSIFKSETSWKFTKEI